MPQQQAQDKWEKFAEPADKWEEFAEPSPEKEAFAHPLAAPTPKPGVLGRPAMPGVASRFAGPQSVALTPDERKSRGIPFEVAKVAAPAIATAIAPEASVPGIMLNIAGRGMAAGAGQHYGGQYAGEMGLPRWVGQVVGGTAGFFSPEIAKTFLPQIIKIPGLARLAAKYGIKASEAAEKIAADIATDTSAESQIARDVVERAARGEPLSKMDEEILSQHVQRNYTPEAGVETSAQKAGKIYAGRGTQFRPTNEQLAIAKQRGIVPPPEPQPVTVGGSGESGASAEAINRTAAERRGGVKYFIEDMRTKQRVPVSSVDVNSGMRVGPGKRIIRSGPEGEFEF